MPNARQEGGWTALHAAAQNGDREIVELLLAHGADLKARADNNQGALDLALQKGHAGRGGHASATRRRITVIRLLNARSTTRRTAARDLGPIRLRDSRKKNWKRRVSMRWAAKEHWRRSARSSANCRPSSVLHSENC